MTIRPCAEFRTDIPSDIVENEHDIVQFGGKAVALAVGEMLAALGYTVEEPSYEGEHGWDLRVKKGDFCLWLEFTEIEEMILQTEDLTPIWKRKVQVYHDALLDLSAALARDPRFHDVFWYSQADLLSGRGGSESPVGPEPARAPPPATDSEVAGEGPGPANSRPAYVQARTPGCFRFLIAVLVLWFVLYVMFGRPHDGSTAPAAGDSGSAAATSASSPGASR